jgi:hypothetical protein
MEEGMGHCQAELVRLEVGHLSAQAVVVEEEEEEEEGGWGSLGNIVPVRTRAIVDFWDFSLCHENCVGEMLRHTSTC